MIYGAHYFRPNAPAAASFVNAVLALTNLRFYYRLNETGGTTMEDAGPNALNGSYTGSPTLGDTGPTSDGNKAVTFDGSTQYGSHAHDAAYNLGTSDWTIGFWMKDASWNTSASSFVVCHDGNGTGGTWEMYCTTTANTMNSRFNGSQNCFSGTGTKNDGNWHLIGCTFTRSGTAQWYLDGSTDGSGTDISAGSGTSIDATQTLYVARRTSTAYLSASLSHVWMCASAVDATGWSTLWGAR